MRFVLASLFCLNVFGAALPTTLLDIQPVRFEPNPGLGQPDSPVKWSARGPGYGFLFLDDSTVLRTSAGAARLTFPGSSAAAKFTPEHPLSAQINYFRGRQVQFTCKPAIAALIYQRGIFPVDRIRHHINDGLQILLSLGKRYGVLLSVIKLLFQF